MSKAIFNLITIALLSIGVFGCKKKFNSLPPNVLFFQITKDGQILPDSVLNKVSLFYYDKGGLKVESPPANYDDKTFLFPANRSSTGLDRKGVLCSGYIAGLVFEGANNLYLKYPDGDVDSLYIEISEIGPEEGKKNRCYCDLPFTIVRFNGKDAPETTDIKTDNGKPIFLFQK